MQILKVIPIAAMLAVLGTGAANAAFINGSSTGLAAPASTITFDEIVLPVDTVLTNQYAGLGVSFSPEAIYSPQTGFGNVQGNDAGNFTLDTGVGPLDPTTLIFTTVQNAVAFSFDADTTPFTFTALLAGSSVDTGSATVGSSSLDDFFGFQGVNFDSIQISQTDVGGGPFWLLDNIQLSNASTTTVPEPITLSLLAWGLAGLGAMRLRRTRTA